MTKMAPTESSQDTPVEPRGGDAPSFCATNGVKLHLVNGLSEERLDYPPFEDHVVCLQFRNVGAEIWRNRRYAGRSRLERGSWMAHVPGETFEAVTQSSYELLQFAIPDTMFQAAATEYGANIRQFGDNGNGFSDENAFLLGLASEMRTSLARDASVNRLYSESLVSAFLGHLLLFSPGSKKHDRQSGAIGGLASWQERRVIEYMSAHLADDISLRSLADVARLSSFHFARTFKESIGVPPHAFLRRLRCDKARDLLVRTDLSMGEVAAEVGYETPQAFARMFRAEIGSSPSEYRRECRL